MNHHSGHYYRCRCFPSRLHFHSATPQRRFSDVSYQRFWNEISALFTPRSVVNRDCNLDDVNRSGIKSILNQSKSLKWNRIGLFDRTWKPDVQIHLWPHYHHSISKSPSPLTRSLFSPHPTFLLKSSFYLSLILFLPLSLSLSLSISSSHFPLLFAQTHYKDRTEQQVNYLNHSSGSPYVQCMSFKHVYTHTPITFSFFLSDCLLLIFLHFFSLSLCYYLFSLFFIFILILSLLYFIFQSSCFSFSLC